MFNIFDFDHDGQYDQLEFLSQRLVNYEKMLELEIQKGDFKGNVTEAKSIFLKKIKANNVRKFEAIDLNHDGKIHFEEWLNAGPDFSTQSDEQLEKVVKKMDAILELIEKDRNAVECKKTKKSRKLTIRC